MTGLYSRRCFHRVSLWAFSILISGLFACDRQSGEPVAPDAPRAGPPLFARRAGAPQGQLPEWASARLAKLIPGFGGAFVEGSPKTLIVYLTDLRRSTTAESLIFSELRAHGRRDLSVSFRQGQYTLLDLDRWRHELLLGFEAVWFSGRSTNGPIEYDWVFSTRAPVPHSSSKPLVSELL